MTLSRFNSKICFMKKIITILLAIFVFLAALAVVKVNVLADSGGYFYGGGAVLSEVMVDKQVKNYEKGIFVDNLSVADPKFKPEQEVVFRVMIKNTGNKDLDSIQIRDAFPSYINFVSGPENSNWDDGKREMTVDLNGLKAGESIDFLVTGKVFKREDLPEEKSIVCVSNFAEARSGDTIDSDTSGLCIQNLEILPPTGPNSVLLMAVLAVGGLGILMVKKFGLKSGTVLHLIK